MKKVLLTIFVVTSSFQVNQAQEVSIRFGDLFGGHYAVDGVFRLGEFSRIYADVSFGNDSVGAE